MSVIHKTNRFAYKYLSILILSSQFLLATFVFWTFQQEPANAAVTITCPLLTLEPFIQKLKQI